MKRHNKKSVFCFVCCFVKIFLNLTWLLISRKQLNWNNIRWPNCTCLLIVDICFNLFFSFNETDKSLNRGQFLCYLISILSIVLPVELGAPGFATTSDKGTITSPNFPGFYTQGITSHWAITLTQSSHVKVWFSLFDINSGDYVSVSSDVSGDINIFFAGPIPEVWWSRETGKLDVSFMTNVMLSYGKGFL